MALTNEAIWLFCPAESATEVFDRLPSVANEPTRPGPTQAKPSAMSSWSGSIS